MLKRFLYFIPGVGGANARMLSERGLITRLPNEYGCTTSTEGPDESGRIGCIVAAGGRPAKYQPQKQRWIALASAKTQGDFGNGFVGLEDIDLPPAPADLERDAGVAGYMLNLSDGNPWRIPLLRKWDESKLAHVAALPQAIGGELVEGKYKFASRVKAEFSELDAISETIFPAFVEKKRFPVDELFELTAKLLAVNYRVGIEEIILLGLLTEEMALAALGLAIDSPGMRRCGEKIARAGLIARQTQPPKDEPATEGTETSEGGACG
jgi:hypothetical protein